MKCKVFWGTPTNAMERFNEWAKGKALSRDVIIHTIYLPYKTENQLVYAMCIIVYHPEGEPWEGQETA